MALRSYNTKADFDATYGKYIEEVYFAGFTRALMFGEVGTPFEQSNIYHKAKGIINALGWTVSTKRLIVGDTFGFLSEAIVRIQGYRADTIVIVDTSNYVQINLTGTEEAEINAIITGAGLNPNAGRGLQIKQRAFDGQPRVRITEPIRNLDITKVPDRKTINDILGTGYDILTDDILPAITDAEAQALSTNLRKLNVGRLIHYITPIDTIASWQDPILNWKTPEQWKALLPNDLIMRCGTYRVI